jgi:hypothetical protein
VSDYRELAGLYDAPATVIARLVGGPYDGREQPFPADLLNSVCPRLVLIAPPDGLLPVTDGSGPPRRLERVAYEALRDADGFLSRDDAGRVRFDFWGVQ